MLGRRAFSASMRKPFSAQSSSYVSPSSGLNGLLVRPAVPEYLHNSTAERSPAVRWVSSRSRQFSAAPCQDAASPLQPTVNKAVGVSCSAA